jgi:hypothetical protein
MGRGCVKTEKWLSKIVFKPSAFLDESRSLTKRNYRLHAPFITYHAAFQVDLYPQSAEVFLHSLGRKRAFTQFTLTFLGFFIPSIAQVMEASAKSS